MDPRYEQLKKQAIQLQAKFRDVLAHNRFDMNAVMLQRQAKLLADDIKLNKDPDELEKRIKIIHNQMQQINHQGITIMDQTYANDLHSHYEAMRNEIRGISEDLPRR